MRNTRTATTSRIDRGCWHWHIAQKSRAPRVPLGAFRLYTDRNSHPTFCNDAGMQLRFIILIGAAFTLAVTSVLLIAARALPQRETVQAACASAFAKTLSESERAAGMRSLEDAERTQWQFVRGARAGLFLRDMDAETRTAALKLIESCLSISGREQWRLIRVIEALNAQNEIAAGVTPPTYGADLYSVILFTTKGEHAFAMQIEGHHFVLNVAGADGVVTVTPSFTGSFPVAVASGADAGKRPLGAAVEIAFALANSMDDAQRKEARILDGTPADVLFAVGADSKSPDMRGLTRASMTSAQQQLVDALLATHAGLLDEEIASNQLKEWRTMHAGQLAFAFVGEADLAKAHYYRLTSPCFTIEYDCTNADPNHVHCVWSDSHANFGGERLRAHLKQPHP